MEDKQYTIKDIAKLCGVSAGTVDRVMHGRSGVSQKSKEKVEAILKEIDYKPNVFAIGLAAKKHYHMTCLVPAFSENDYWSSVYEGIKRAKEELIQYNISIDCIHFNYEDIDTFTNAGKQLIEQKPDGAMIVPTTLYTTLQLAEELKNADIPFTIIDVAVKDAGELTYIGQDSFRSGYIAAKTLLRTSSNTEMVMFLSENRNGSLEIQMSSRREGFMEYIRKECSNIVVHEVKITPETLHEKLDKLFAEHPNVKLGVSFNSRIYRVAKYLEEKGIAFERLIGYDLLPQNIEYLKRGVVNMLIGQRPALQSYRAIKALADFTVFKKQPEKIQYMPIDLLTADNIEYYIEI